ncbi:lasso RiPP family leader peptide-containing protein [Amycolatopsis sp. NPDC102389]|uniref:lasso RiPP family leader peptide-containing protein n=1 Tax=Amycolatopsis sp. NPDC102389 TaxID=3363941 RepID=UPI003805D5CA
MKLLPVLRPSPARDTADAVMEPSAEDVGYEPPLLFDLGHVRELTLGSSSSGSADSNSQYYW